MAAKLLHSLTDDNLELQKQIGCMTGIFQLFDRPHILSKNLPPAGVSNFNGSNLKRGSNDERIRTASTEKISVKNSQEKQRIYTESSRASYSSLSRSSSSSSLECNRATLSEPVSFDRIAFPENPSRDPAMSLQSSSPQFGRQNRDLRDLVKDSMYREIHGPSAKARTAEAVDPVMKYGNSPRMHSEMTAGSRYSGLDTKHGNSPRMNDDLKESLTVLAKFQEAPCHHNERRELLRSFSYHSRDGSSSLISRDAPRFSYDGREVNRAPFDYQDVSKSTLKLKDLPRLSLDGSKTGSKSNFLKSMQQDGGDQFDSKVQNLQQSAGQQARPPSIVAKLMGLETLPHSLPPNDTNFSVTKRYPDKDLTLISKPSAERDPGVAKISSSSKNLWKEPSSPSWRNTDSSMKPLSRFPIEPAPWKRNDGKRSSMKPEPRTMRAPAKAETAFLSVYSEIEKRLKDLEFTRSGKDLRALKQILEAMQSKKLLQSQKEVQGSNFRSHKDHEEKQLRFKHEARTVDRRKPQIEEAIARRNANVGQHSQSPIVIMKPAKYAASVMSLDGLSGATKLQDNEFVDHRKGLNYGRAAEDLSSKSSQRESAATSANMKNDRTLKATQTSNRPQQLTKDGYGGSGKNSGSISPRLQQKKLELEKRAHPPTTPDSSKSRRQPNKQQGESNSPGGRRRPKLSNIQESGEKLNETGNLNYHENESLGQSNASVTTSETVIYDSAKQISTIALHEESAEFGIVTVDYSSPVSVLDNRIQKDGPPSLVTYKVGICMDKQKDLNVVQGSSVYIDMLGSREYGFRSEINQNKLQNIENLVQKLRRLNSSHDEAGTDYIASLCENSDPDHRYISEILLASGLLLRDLGSSLMDFQFHPSGHPINPELFLVLEQTKASTALKEESCREKKTEMMMIIKGKLRRKLVFDTVNEILGRKLVSAGPSTEPLFRPLKLSRKTLNAQKLLGELCSEIEALQSRNTKCSSDGEDDPWKSAVHKDVMYHQSERWTDFDDEISGAVLDVERSIFKDLVNEIVIGDSAGLKTKPAGRRRSFPK